MIHRAALLLSALLVLVPRVVRAEPSRQKLFAGYVVTVDLVEARSLRPDDRAPGPALVPSAEVERRARAVLEADAPVWTEIVDWVKRSPHRFRALLGALATDPRAGRDLALRIEVAHAGGFSPSQVGDEEVLVPSHAGLALVSRPLGVHADWLRRKLAVDFAHALLGAPPQLRAKLRRLSASAPNDEAALTRTVDDEIGGTSFLGTVGAALAFAEHPAIVDRWAAAPLEGDDAAITRAIVGRAMLALRGGTDYPTDIYPAITRLAAPIARVLIEWLTLSVPDGRWSAQVKTLRASADAYGRRGGGSYLDAISWSLSKSGRLR